MKTLVITKDVGGQALEASEIENYPGFLKVSGPKLMEKFKEQAVKAGAEIVLGIVSEIKAENKEFIVKTDETEYRGKSVILAFGKSPRSLNVPGENQFIGKGVSYCVTCDIPLYKNKTVAIVGGGNAALDGTLYGSKIAKKIYLIHRRDEFRGFEYLIEKVRKKRNVEFVLNSIVKEIRGDNRVRSVVVENVQTKEVREIKVDGVFIEIGSEVKTDFIKDLVKLDENGQIIVNNKCETYYPNSDKIRPGIFAAGDVTATPFKQIVVAAGEGCKAALQAYNFIHGLKVSATVDWTEIKKR